MCKYSVHLAGKHNYSQKHLMEECNLQTAGLRDLACMQAQHEKLMLELKRFQEQIMRCDEQLLRTNEFSKSICPPQVDQCTDHAHRQPECTALLDQPTLADDKENNVPLSICSSSKQAHILPAAPMQISVKSAPALDSCQPSSILSDLLCCKSVAGFAQAAPNIISDQAICPATPARTPTAGAVAAKKMTARKSTAQTKRSTPGQGSGAASGEKKQGQKSDKVAEEGSGKGNGPQLEQAPHPQETDEAEQQYVACTAHNIMSMLLPKDWIRPLWSLDLYLAGNSVSCFASETLCSIHHA